MKRLSRPGLYANVTATVALVVASAAAGYAVTSSLADGGGGERARSAADTAGQAADRSRPSAGLDAGRSAGGSAGAPGPAIKAKVVDAVASAAAPPDTTLVSFTTDFPSVPAHGCIFRLVSYEPSDWYEMPLWIDNYLPPGLVATNLQGQSYGASLNVCNVTAAALDPASRTYYLLLVNRFSVQPQERGSGSS